MYLKFLETEKSVLACILFIYRYIRLGAFEVAGIT